MISCFFANDLPHDLRTAMLQDRRRQFVERQGWALDINAKGEEIDEYDALNPLYVICRDSNGGHAGSLRMLPTQGPTMVNDHFTNISGMTIKGPQIWEATRFCATPNVAGSLMLASCELGLRFGLTHCVGVFDTAMIRVYRKLGWSPEVIGSEGGISVGIWNFTKGARAGLCERHRIPQDTPTRWFDQSFPTAQPLAA